MRTTTDVKEEFDEDFMEKNIQYRFVAADT